MNNKQNYLESKSKYLGMKKLANNGMMMECIEYNSSRNITVRFEDGTIVPNRCIKTFKNGCIAHPDFYAKNNIGKETCTIHGDKIKIVDYIDFWNVIVEFEDGVRKRTCMKHFNKGTVSYPIEERFL